MKTIFLALFIFQIGALAQTTQSTVINSISGGSRAVQEADGTWTVYGGMQEGGSPGSYSCNTGSTCDTCTGGSDGTGLFPCNLTGVFDSTIVTFDASSNVEVGTTKWYLCNGTTEAAVSNRNVQLTVTWGEVCDAVEGNSSTCDDNVNQTFQLGVGTSCSALTEKVNVKFISRNVDVTAGSAYTPDTTFTDCNTSNTRGACFFKLFPGDEKLYLDPDIGVGVTENFPDTDVSSVKYTELVFFYKETGDPTNANDLATFNAITTADNIATMSVAETGEPTGTYIDGLSNDVRYCFRMGVQDSTGNIELMSPADCTANGGSCDDVCGTPSEVVGLLSDKNCFIATAAYGSSLDQHVNSLREFRNQFLIPHWVGRKLIRFYYKYSPPLAQWISQNDWAKSIVRTALWPILGWVYLALSWGWAGFLAPLGVAGGVLAWRRRARN